MDNTQLTVIGILIPFLGTTIGAALVFLLKNKMTILIEKALLGFASGVMIAASIWSLLIPAINMSREQGIIAWVPATVGFLIGIFLLMFINKQVEKIESKKSEKKSVEKLAEKHKTKDGCIGKTKEMDNKKDKNRKPSKNIFMLVLAVTLHNIPEGMAVGVVFAGLLIGSAGITVAGAFALAIGIAVQNIPEGAIISMPLKSAGESKVKSFICGTLSGMVEPIGAIITVALTNIIVPFLPYLLSFAAGAMIYVVSSELIPDIKKGEKENIGIIGLAIGFCIMMILDVAL